MAFIYNDQTGDFDYIQTPPIVRSFTADTVSPYVGDTMCLRWRIDDAEHVYINGNEQQGNELSITATASGIQAFKLRATNADGASERTITVNVNAQPEFDIHCSAMVIHKGADEQVTIRWSIANATRLDVRYNGNTENKPLLGEMQLSPTEDSVIVFNAVGTNGNRRFERSLLIKVRDAAQVSFKADRLFSYPNLPITLSWSVTNAIRVTLDDFGIQPDENSIIVNPGVDTTYRLRVVDDFGEDVYTICVRMLPLPVIKELLVPAPVIKKDLGIRYNPPQFNAKVPIPTFDSPLAKLRIPHIPALRQSSFFVEEKCPQKSPRLSFKSLLTYFFRKVTIQR